MLSKNGGVNRPAVPLSRHLLRVRDLSTAPWFTKRAVLNRRGRLLLNARLTERHVWDERAIDEHYEWPVQRLITIWPGPDVANWV